MPGTELYAARDSAALHLHSNLSKYKVAVVEPAAVKEIVEMATESPSDK